MSSSTSSGSVLPTPSEPKEEEESSAVSSSRPKSDNKVSPSKQGRFLSALERHKKDETKETIPPESKEESETGAPQTDVFHLAAVKKIKHLRESESEGFDEESPPPSASEKKPQTPSSYPQQPIPAPIEPKTVLPQTAPHTVAAATPAQPRSQVAKVETSSMHVANYARPDVPTIETKQQTPSKPSEKSSTSTDHPTTPRFVPPVTVPHEPTISVDLPTPQTSTPERLSGEHLLGLVKQAVDAIAILSSKHDTSIVVTLKYPPLFEGSSLLITESSLAKKEFNLTFSDLSPAARQLIESTASQQQLRQALIDKGYMMHTVIIESPLQPSITTHAGTSSHAKFDSKDSESSSDSDEEDLAGEGDAL